MHTVLWRIDADNIENSIIKKAACLLKEGGLVAFPTETVYGLGANGLDPSALRKIFEAKGRPQDNPLILHVAELKDAFHLAEKVPSKARILMEEFWPGPLTLVLPKSRFVPPEVTAGLDTVAIRMPAHPLALALIREAGLPIAAPSANRSGYPSPTTASHVLDDLEGRIDAVLDGGPTGIGLESTVLDVSGERPVILRPGGVTEEDLRRVIGEVELDRGITDSGIAPKSPGMKYTHYSPRAEVILLYGETPRVIAERVIMWMEKFASEHKMAGLLLTEETWNCLGASQDYLRAKNAVYVKNIGSRQNLEGIARLLYDELRRCDKAGADVILTETYQEEGIGRALMNRLRKSSGYRIADC